MKQIILATFASLLISAPALAQDAIGYIPGMPVPQTNSTQSSASADTAANSDQNNGGKVTKVSKSGDAAFGSQPAQHETAPVNVQQNSYKGVTPPTRLEPENKATFNKTSDNQLSWIGFMPEESGHRIFVQTTTPSTYERIATASDRVEILVKNTKLAVSNNNRELNMSYFQTPFAKAKASKAGQDVKIVVQLKSAQECTIQQQDNIISIIAK